jgi:hypothetical protein
LSLNCKKNKSACLTERKFISLASDPPQDIASGDDVFVKINELLFNTSVGQFSLIAYQKDILNVITATDSERRDLFKKIRDLEFEKEVKENIVPKIEAIDKEVIEVDKELYRLQHIDYTPKEILELPFPESELSVKQKELKSLELEKSRLADKQLQYNQKLADKNMSEMQVIKKEELLKDKTTQKENIEKQILYYNTKALDDEQEKTNKQIEDIKAQIVSKEEVYKTACDLQNTNY